MPKTEGTRDHSGIKTQCTTIIFIRLLPPTSLFPGGETLFHFPLINIPEIFKDFLACRFILAANQQNPRNIQRLFRLQNCLGRKSTLSWNNSKNLRPASSNPAATSNHPAASSNQPATSSNQPATSSNQQQHPATSSSNQQQQPAAATSIHPTSSTYTINASLCYLLVITTFSSSGYPASS